MNFLKNQVMEARLFTNRLISEMPEELWFTIPQNTDSNFAWQIGHILMAQNFHIFSCSLGRNKKVIEEIPLQDYVKLFGGLGNPHRSVDKNSITISSLKSHFDFVHNLCLEGLELAKDDILKEKLEPIPFKHPVAENKYQALSWSFKHEMWHCAEMEQIKILLNRQFKWLS